MFDERRAREKVESLVAERNRLGREIFNLEAAQELVEEELEECKQKYAEECAESLGFKVGDIIDVPGFTDDRQIFRSRVQVEGFFGSISVEGGVRVMLMGRAVNDAGKPLSTQRRFDLRAVRRGVSL